jgi:SAM-dependent methyltransferase
MKKANQYETNREIEALIMRKDSAGQPFTALEVDMIRRYSGSGGHGGKGASGEGVLYEFYTPEYVAEIMWKLAAKFGYDGGNVLEPSCGTGRLIEHAPDKSKVVGFEINRFSRRVAEISYPEATFHEGYFETAFMQSPRHTTRIRGGGTWLEGYPFSLVIGNPPYGRYRNLYSSHFKSPKMPTLELFFLYYGLRILKPGGLLVYITSSNILRNGQSYDAAKEQIGKIGELVEAFRLPPVFRFSQVPVDIHVFRRK